MLDSLYTYYKTFNIKGYYTDVYKLMDEVGIRRVYNMQEIVDYLENFDDCIYFYTILMQRLHLDSELEKADYKVENSGIHKISNAKYYEDELGPTLSVTKDGIKIDLIFWDGKIFAQDDNNEIINYNDKDYINIVEGGYIKNFEFFGKLNSDFNIVNYVNTIFENKKVVDDDYNDYMSHYLDDDNDDIE